MTRRPVFKPTATQLELAAEWLRQNEGGGSESESCRAVAHWLDWQAEEKMIRDAARRGGVPVARLRAKIEEGRP